MFTLEKKRTNDGSFTLYVKELDEHYHSVNGAVTESLHVFIKNGLKKVEKSLSQESVLKVLEIGFGTGLNALLTALCCEKKIEYHTLEPFPIKNNKLLELPNVTIDGFDFSSERIRQLYSKILSSDWGNLGKINAKFSLLKHTRKLEDFTTENEFNLVYFDAFAPQVQPELWQKAIFQQLYEQMNKNAIITTYCAKGQVRRDWQGVGFSVERLPGAPGKREMLVGVKK